MLRKTLLIGAAMVMALGAPLASLAQQGAPAKPGGGAGAGRPSGGGNPGRPSGGGGAKPGRPGGGAGPSRPGGGGNSGNRPGGRPGTPGRPSHPGGGSGHNPGHRPGGGHPGKPSHPGKPGHGSPGHHPNHGRPPNHNRPGYNPAYRPSVGYGRAYHGAHFYYGGRRYYGMYAAPYRYPPGWGYRRWAVGAVLPGLFLSSAYYFTAYATIGLPSAPYGQQWVRYGPDLLLVAVPSGRIISVQPGVFY